MPPIEAYELGPAGEHIPVEPRDRSSGTATQESAPASSGTDLHAAEVPPGSAPAPATPPQNPSLAVPGDGEASDDEDEPEPEVATMDYVQRSIKRQTRRYRALERAREADRQVAEQRLAQQQGQIEVLTRMLQGSAPDLPPAPAHPAGPPQPETYATHDEYVRAAARYEAQQEFQARDQQTQQERQREQMQQMQRDLLEREQTFKAQHPDFDQVVRAGLAGKVAPHVQQALMMLPDGPALAYTLAQQQDLVQKLNTLPPPLVFAELGRLSGPGSGPPFPATQDSAHADVPGTPSANGTRPPPLPEPLRPVGGGGSPTPPGFRDDMSQAEYRAWRARTSQLPKWRTG